MFFIFRVCCCRCISIVCYSVWVYTVHIGRLPNKHADCRACLCNIVDQKKKCYPVFCEPVFLCSRHLSYVYACVHIRAFIQNRIFRKLSIIPDTTPISIVQLWKLMENVPDQQTTLTVTTDQPDSISNAIHPKQFDLICLFINGVHEKCHSCNCTLHVISREI